jgi:hypothetical protein
MSYKIIYWNGMGWDLYNFHKIEILFKIKNKNIKLKMSTEIMNTVVNESIVNVPTTQDKIMRSLPAKYNKFASFAFWLLREMKDNAILSSVTYDNTCSMMNLLSGDIPLQIEFYERFFSEMKVSDRIMKSEIRSYKENNKNKKTKPQKSRNNKKNGNNTNNSDDIISLIVMKANGIDVEPVLPSEDLSTPVQTQSQEKVEKKKRVKKPKSEVQSEVLSTPVENESVLQSDVLESTVENQSEEKVEKKKRVKKPKSEETVLPSEVLESTVENQSEEKVEKKKRVKKPKSEETVLQSDVLESTVENQIVLQSELLESTVENQSEEKVEKKKRVKKPKSEQETVSEVVESVLQSEGLNTEIETPDSGVEITLHAVTVDGVEYFYDSDYKLYNASYEIIGSIDIHSLSISIV